MSLGMPCLFFFLNNNFTHLEQIADACSMTHRSFRGNKDLHGLQITHDTGREPYDLHHLAKRFPDLDLYSIGTDPAQHTTRAFSRVGPRLAGRIGTG